MTTTSLVLLLLFIVTALCIGAIINSWQHNLPKWTKVKFYVIDQKHFGMSYTAIENGLMERFNLTPQQAKLCVNNYEDDEWLQMQSFLTDDTSI